MLKHRVYSAIVLIPILVAAIWFGEPWFSIVIAVFAFLGAFEFYRIADSSGWKPFSFPGTVLILLFILAAHSDDARVMPLVITGSVVLLLIRILWRPSKDAFVNWAWTVAGVFYIGWMLSHFVLMRDWDDGRDWVYLALLATFASDTSAYFVGRKFGRHHMAPAISPAKTWEGAAGSVVGTVGATVLISVITGLDEIGYRHIIPLGFLISFFAQMGDLAESVFKRTAKAKDAGSIIPGHGGILDRLDSILFTVVLVYYYVIWVVQ